LKIDSHKNDLKKLRGVGDKTADYFRLLVGLPTSAIDRHLSNFIHLAGLQVDDYQSQRELIEATAKELNVTSGVLDHAIWKYMSGNIGKKY
jgi:endonuclease III